MYNCEIVIIHLIRNYHIGIITVYIHSLWYDQYSLQNIIIFHFVIIVKNHGLVPHSHSHIKYPKIFYLKNISVEKYFVRNVFKPKLFYQKIFHPNSMRNVFLSKNKQSLSINRKYCIRKLCCKHVYVIIVIIMTKVQHYTNIHDKFDFEGDF